MLRDGNTKVAVPSVTGRSNVGQFSKKAHNHKMMGQLNQRPQSAGGKGPRQENTEDL